MTDATSFAWQPIAVALAPLGDLVRPQAAQPERWRPLSAAMGETVQILTVGPACAPWRSLSAALGESGPTPAEEPSCAP